MNLLLSNDDGYDAPGIQTLYRILSREHSVYICAPLRQMSASSHSVNIFRPLEFKRINSRITALDGTPADCVKAAISGIYKNVNFDAVVSGINDGPNLGDDVLYSGTVAAAREGSLNGLFSLACSRDGWDLGTHYEGPSRFILNLLQTLPRDIFQTNTILNINFPADGKWNGVAFCSLGIRVYQDEAVLYREDGKDFLRIEGEAPGFRPQPGSDLDAIHSGQISITALANQEHDPVVHDSLSRTINDINRKSSY